MGVVRSVAVCIAVQALFVQAWGLADDQNAGGAKTGLRNAPQLIADLGSADYMVRERATETLSKMGGDAFRLLEASTKHPDREIRLRVLRLLGLMRQEDLDRRLEAFLKGDEASGGRPLPAWERFQKTHGDGDDQRKLFVEMQRADAALLRTLDESPSRAADLLAIRIHQSQQTLQFHAGTSSAGQFIVSLFVAAEPDVKTDSNTLSLLFGQCYQPALREALETGRGREMPRKMLGSIIRRCEDMSALQAMNVASQFKLPDGIVPAVKILRSSQQPQPAPLVQLALVTIAKLGDSSHLPLVDNNTRLGDQTQIGQFRENDTTYSIELRDLALATAVVLSKQELREYFEIPRNDALDDPQMIFLNPRLVGFPNAGKRAKSFARWEQHKAELTSRQR